MTSYLWDWGVEGIADNTSANKKANFEHQYETYDSEILLDTPI